MRAFCVYRACTSNFRDTVVGIFKDEKKALKLKNDYNNFCVDKYYGIESIIIESDLEDKINE